MRQDNKYIIMQNQPNISRDILRYLILNFVDERTMIRLRYVNKFCYDVVEEYKNIILHKTCPCNSYSINFRCGIIKYDNCMKNLYANCKNGLYIHIEVFNWPICYNQLDEAFEASCVGGHIDLVKYCINHGARKYITGLKEAMKGQHKDIIKLMESYGAKYCRNIGRYHGRSINHRECDKQYCNIGGI
jgi:hypothetical protein